MPCGVLRFTSRYFHRTLCEHLPGIRLFSMYRRVAIKYEPKITIERNEGNRQIDKPIFACIKYERIFLSRVRKRRYTREDATCSSMTAYNLLPQTRKIFFNDTRSRISPSLVRNVSSFKYWRVSETFQLLNLELSLSPFHLLFSRENRSVETSNADKFCQLFAKRRPADSDRRVLKRASSSSLSHSFYKNVI